MSPLYQAEGLRARHSVSSLKDFPFHSHVSTFFSTWFLKVFLAHRHVKGRVLVGLSDGTLAIFHRGVGEGSTAFSNERVIFTRCGISL